MSKTLSDIITEFVWKFHTIIPSYGIRELKVIQGMHPTVDMTTLKKIVQHAQRTPKTVDWDIIRQRMVPLEDIMTKLETAIRIAKLITQADLNELAPLEIANELYWC